MGLLKKNNENTILCYTSEYPNKMQSSGLCKMKTGEKKKVERTHLKNELT